MPNSILLTGAAGFLGSHLAEALVAQGHSVTGIDNFDPFYPEKIKWKNLEKVIGDPLFKLVKIDITDYLALETLNGTWDVVIHIAAKAGVLPSIKSPHDYASTNINGTLNILEFMKKRGINKYLFASSSSIYGNNKEIPFREDQKVDGPISPYAFSKKSGELMNFTYHHLYGINCLNLRLFTLYGARQRPDLSIHKFVKLIEGGQPIDMYGDGSTARDYTHVSDIVSGFVKGMDYLFKQKKVYEIVNIGNRNPIKLRDLIDKIYEVTGKAKNINQLPSQPGDVEITFADISKAEKLLGYTPEVKFEEGLKDFVNWYRENKHYL